MPRQHCLRELCYHRSSTSWSAFLSTSESPWQVNHERSQKGGAKEAPAMWDADFPQNVIFQFFFLPARKFVLLLPASLLELPWWLSGKETTCQCRRQGFNPWVENIPWRRKWQPVPVFLPEKSHGQRSPLGYSPWGHKSVGHSVMTKHQQQHPC